MRIVTYDLEKNENDMPMLVKESSQNYHDHVENTPTS